MFVLGSWALDFVFLEFEFQPTVGRQILAINPSASGIYSLLI